MTKTVRGGEREAHRALAAMLAENDRGAHNHNHTNATVGELLEEWFALAGPGYSPKGARETRGVMDRNMLPFLANVPLSKLGAADIDRFYRRLREKGGRAGRPLAPATIRRAHGILHDLRHYGATRLLSEGVDVHTVAGRGGHWNAATTLNVYSHLLPKSDREAANVLGRIFDEVLRKETDDPPAEERRLDAYLWPVFDAGPV